MDYRIKGEKVRKVYKVPILGKWLQVLDFFRAIPARFQDYDQKIDKINETCVSKNKFEIKMNRIEVKIAENDKLGQSIEELEQHFSETIEAYEKKIHLLTQENEKVKEYCRLIEMSRIPQSFEQILGNQEWLCKLNLQLSIHPTIWGDKNRLHISPLAAMQACFFNTNSGNITIGDYTYAGSNVSILAGSHDMYLEGLPRRDAELKQDCDIIIGKGVWLASGSIILGPCKIGDNAVIAAGAVVIPGTEIEDNAVYAGVPAKKKKMVDTSCAIEDKHVVRAIQRENGVLFVDGWSDKKEFMHEDGLQIGHLYIKNNASIYTNQTNLRLLLRKLVDEPVSVSIFGTRGEWNKELNNSNEIWDIVLNGTENDLNELTVLCTKNAIGKLMISIL